MKARLDLAQSVLLWSGLPVLGMFLPVYLRDVGLPAAQIGTLLAIGPAVAIVLPPLVGMLADRARSKNAVLLTLTAGGGLVALLYPLGGSFASLFAIGVLLALFQSTQGPLSEAILIESLQRQGRSYGPVRLAGTLGFAVMALAVGAALSWDTRVVFWVVGAVAFVNLLVLTRLPRVQGHQSSGAKVPLRALFHDRKLVLMLVFALLASVSIGFYSNYFGLFFLSLGGKKSEVGLLLFLMAVSEFPFLVGADRLLARWGRRALLLLALAVLAVRFALMATLADPVWMFPLSLLNGATFIVFAYGVATYIGTESDKALRATGQSVLGVAMSMGRVVGAVGGGLLIDGVGMSTTFLVLATANVVFFVAFFLKSRSRA